MHGLTVPGASGIQSFMAAIGRPKGFQGICLTRVGSDVCSDCCLCMLTVRDRYWLMTSKTQVPCSKEMYLPPGGGRGQGIRIKDRR